MATTPPKVIISAQVDEEIRAELEREAEAADRTLSAQVRRVLSEHVRNAEREPEPAR